MKKYIFDLDGTLVSSMEYWRRAMSEMLADNGIPCPDDIIQRTAPWGMRGGVKYMQELGAKGTSEELFETLGNKMEENYAQRIMLKNGVEKYLKGLAQEGASMAVLTASPHKYIDPCLKRNGVFDLFENIWTINDFGSLAKGDKEIYVECAKRLGCDTSDIVFFDDNITALSAAKEAGVYIVGVYDISSDEETENIKRISNKYIDSFERLM